MKNKNESKRRSWAEVLLWLFPMLFLVDDILGFNGYQFTIAGKSIRIILFCISVALLCAYSLYVCHENRISLLPGNKDKVWLFKLLKPIDYFVMLFIVGNAIWATVVPLAVRDDMLYSFKDFSTILVLVLYFPVMFLIRTGRLKLERLEKYIYVLCLILAGWHCFMYVGERLNPGFYEGYYDFIDLISFGTAVRSDIIVGFGITRVVQTTSLFLLVGAFLAIRYCLKERMAHLLSLVVFIFAICVTYTKSIWFGFALGFIVYLIPAAIIQIDKGVRKRCLVTGLAAVMTVLSLNYLVFDNSIFTRVMNTARTQEEIQQLQERLEAMAGTVTEPPVVTDAPEVTEPPVVTDAPDATETTASVSHDDIAHMQNEIWDARGTQQANNLRAQQNQALLNKWQQSKLIGFGYGSYAEDCIRSEIYPFMYESTLPALMMKIGVAGCLIWVALIVVTTVTACKSFWKKERRDVFWWLGLAISYALAVQTNPFLFTFAGFSILLYLMLAMQEGNVSRC